MQEPRSPVTVTRTHPVESIRKRASDLAVNKLSVPLVRPV